MKRRTFLEKGTLAAAALVTSPWISGGNTGLFSKNTCLDTEALESADIAILVLSGSPRQRGRVHGEELREKISELTAIWKGELHQKHKVDPDTYIANFLGNTQFEEAVAKWCPDLLEEVKGIAEGSGIDYKTIFGFQTAEEEWWYARARESGGPAPVSRQCSGLGAFDQEGLPSLVAQNQDFTMKDGNEAILHIKHQDSSLESFVFTLAGLVGINPGMNSQAVAMTSHSLPQLANRVDGLPVAFVLRGALARKSFHDAVKFINKIHHATGQNYILGGPEEVGSFECSAHKVSRYIPYPGANRTFHTNHALVNDEWDEMFEKAVAKGQFEGGLKNTRSRFEALEKRLKDPKKKITVDIAKDALSSRDDPNNPVCVAKRKKTQTRGFTAGCGIAVLSDPPEFHFAPGPPCQTAFGILKF